jgi:hypothetical protein
MHRLRGSAGTWQGLFQAGKGAGMGGGEGFWCGFDFQPKLFANVAQTGISPDLYVTEGHWMLIACVVRSTTSQAFYIYDFTTTSWIRNTSSASNTGASTHAGDMVRIGNFNDTSGNDAFSEPSNSDPGWMGVWTSDLSDGGVDTPTSLLEFINNGPWNRIDDADCKFFVAFDSDLAQIPNEAGSPTIAGIYAQENTVPIGYITTFPNQRPAGGPTYKNLTGSSSGIGAVSATITRKRRLTAASAGVAVSAGAVSRKRQLVVTSAGLASVSATISRKRVLVAASVGTTSVSAAISRKRMLVVASVGTASVNGVITKLGAATFSAVLATATGQSAAGTLVAATGFVAQLMQSTSSMYVPNIQAGAKLLAQSTSISGASQDAVIRTSNGILATVATGAVSSQVSSILSGVRITASLMSVNAQMQTLVITLSGMFSAQTMQFLADSKSLNFQQSNQLLAQTMLANALAQVVFHKAEGRWFAQTGIVNAQLRFAAIGETFSTTSPGPDIITAENIVPMIVSADVLVPYLYAGGSMVPMIYESAEV